MTMLRLGAAALLLTGLAACDRSDPPSQRIERAAEDALSELEGEKLPAPPAGPYAPRDECRDLPGASEFLASLESAVEARDADALLALVAEDVRLDFGGGSGRSELRQRLASEDYNLWTELEEIVALGCASEDSSMITLPWYFAQDFRVDPYMGALVVGEDIPLRAAPADDADVLARISWDAVEALPVDRVDSNYEQFRWTDPESGDELTGFIHVDSLRSLIDYRIGATRRNQRWSIVFFIAGD